LIEEAKYYTVKFRGGSFYASQARFAPDVLRFYGGKYFILRGYVKLKKIKKVTSHGSCVTIHVKEN